MKSYRQFCPIAKAAEILAEALRARSIELDGPAALARACPRWLVLSPLASISPAATA